MSMLNHAHNILHTKDIDIGVGMVLAGHTNIHLPQRNNQRFHRTLMQDANTLSQKLVNSETKPHNCASYKLLHLPHLDTANFHHKDVCNTNNFG